MNLKRPTNELLKSGLPLMTLATCLAMSSAAPCFGLSAIQRLAGATQKRVLARGHLTGTRELQQVVTWRTSGAAHLAIETSGRNPRTIWQADEPSPVVDIKSVQIIDLDDDGLAEIVGLWCQGTSVGCQLRVIHWDRRAQSFVDLKPKGEDASAGTMEIQRFRILSGASRRRIIVYKRASTGWPIVAGGQVELRGSEIVRVGGGAGVTKQNESGIEGQAVISPTRPGPVREGQSDSAPFKTTLVILRASDGSEAARVETGSDGRFRVALAPGTYKVGPPEGIGRRLPRAGQEIVTVVPGRFAQVTISFDSGMR